MVHDQHVSQWRQESDARQLLYSSRERSLVSAERGPSGQEWPVWTLDQTLGIHLHTLRRMFANDDNNYLSQSLGNPYYLIIGI